VFHSSDVIGTERHYIEDEPGVMKFDILSQDIAQGQFMHNTGQEHIRTNPWSGDLPSSTLASFDSNMFPLSRMGDISFVSILIFSIYSQFRSNSIEYVQLPPTYHQSNFLKRYHHGAERTQRSISVPPTRGCIILASSFEERRDSWG